MEAVYSLHRSTKIRSLAGQKVVGKLFRVAVGDLPVSVCLLRRWEKASDRRERGKI